MSFFLFFVQFFFLSSSYSLPLFQSLFVSFAFHLFFIRFTSLYCALFNIFFPINRIKACNKRLKAKLIDEVNTFCQTVYHRKPFISLRFCFFVSNRQKFLLLYKETENTEKNCRYIKIRWKQFKSKPIKD